MPATRGPLLLLLLAWAGLTAAAHESIILKMAEGEFTVQSGEDLGQPVGERLRRLRLPQGADVGAELVRLRSLKSKRGLFLQPRVLPVVLSAWCHPHDSAACPCCLCWRRAAAAAAALLLLRPHLSPACLPSSFRRGVGAPRHAHPLGGSECGRLGAHPHPPARQPQRLQAAVGHAAHRHAGGLGRGHWRSLQGLGSQAVPRRFWSGRHVSVGLAGWGLWRLPALDRVAACSAAAAHDAWMLCRQLCKLCAK